MSSLNKKDCGICVYAGVCEGRAYNSTIIDCCIPAAPLRKLQARTKTADEFAVVTNRYIARYKAASSYWITQVRRVADS